MSNSDNKKNKRSAPIDYEGKGGLGSARVMGLKAGKRNIFDNTFYGNSYKNDKLLIYKYVQSVLWKGLVLLCQKSMLRLFCLP